MTREDVIRMARKAYGDWYPHAVPHELERFAVLVAAAEREACAAICDRFQAREMQPAECAAAIRARGEK